MQLVRRKCRFHRVVSRLWRIDRRFLANSHTHLSTKLEIYTGKDDKHWIPTQKVEFEKPLPAGAPPKIVLKLPEGRSNVDDTTLPPTPMSEKLRKNFGPGSPTDLAYRDLIATFRKHLAKSLSTARLICLNRIMRGE